MRGEHKREQRIKAIAAWYEKAKPSKMRSCVERKIPIFSHEHPDWDHDHVIAAAYGCATG
jgi:hypothetical protein